MSPRRVYLGLDPGQSGGVAAVLADGWSPVVYPWPDTERDTADLLHSLVTGNVDPVAVIEAVGAMPRQGVASTFAFGRHYGFLRGVLIAYKVPFLAVRPAKWQAAMGCRSKGDKNVTKARAQELAPAIKLTHATADALLLAIYCSRQDWRGIGSA